MCPCWVSWDCWYLCRRACRSEYLLCWQSLALWGRCFCTQACLAWDTLHSRYPRQHPLNSSTCRHGIVLAVARHTRPHATSCSTAHYAYLEKLVMKLNQSHLCFDLTARFPFSNWKRHFHQLMGCSVLLPTHVRPVLSKVRPSAHSQRNEPWVLTHRPFVQTPGKTSHSLMSTGRGTF